MPECSGIVTVSSGYIKMIQKRYRTLACPPWLTLPFGALPHDFRIAAALPNSRTNLDATDILYVGRGGSDMSLAVGALFTAFSSGLKSHPELFSRVHFTFIGTSYAASGKGIKTIEPLAEQIGIGSYVTEQTDRLPYFHCLKRLQEADLLFMPGSTDSSYTASKLFPYIKARREILAVFNEESSVVNILKTTHAGNVVTFRSNDTVAAVGERLKPVLTELLRKLPIKPETDWEAFEPFTAREMTRQQCEFFSSVIEGTPRPPSPHAPDPPSPRPGE